MSRYDFWDGQEHPIDILLFSSFEVSKDMRVTNFKTRFLKNGSSDHFGTNVPDLGSSSILLGYKSPSYDFSKKFKVLLGRCALSSSLKPNSLFINTSKAFYPVVLVYLRKIIKYN